ncbi:hypothetical protein HCN51_39725 [Nonomuraea sp. FMUSA5-5]|uniref:ATP-grasp domain-containing protein n=1 Tax=Nonomuraea composti TaxID=2720023 RepID=A0ABX1BCI7_9ACTN|nr:hypothetical protein [Nonomuraea sp. FMUSA5-5]NJP95498.1 hypothetical protein [Nonomuraea sp. FMUSA5-5]
MVEAAGGLAPGEAEDGGADEAFGAGGVEVLSPDRLCVCAFTRHVRRVQEEVPGPLVMVQAVFAAGEPIAFHACVRAGEGARGGAGRKRSVLLPEVRRHVERLGGELRWHGALSADVILGPDGPVLIDVNPRLVEPVNALLSGVDLVTPLLDLARGRSPVPQPASVPGVRTHQLLLAVLGAAERSGRRRAILAELAAATTAALVRPDLWRWFASGSVADYALSPAGWRRIVEFSRTRPGSTAGTWSGRGDRRG